MKSANFFNAKILPSPLADSPLENLEWKWIYLPILKKKVWRLKNSALKKKPGASEQSFDNELFFPPLVWFLAKLLGKFFIKKLESENQYRWLHVLIIIVYREVPG